MAIGNPTSLGTNNSTSADVSSITLTTSAAIVAGNIAWVAVQFISVAAQTVSSVSDGTNSYTLALRANTGLAYTELWYKENAAAVSSGATITATLSGSTSGGNGYGIQAFQSSGVVTSSAMDKTASYAGAATATPTATTATLTQATEIAIGVSFVGYANTVTPFTEASGFTNLFSAITTGFNTTKTSIGYKVVAATTAVAYSPVWSTAPNSGSPLVLATFKGIQPAAFTPQRRTTRFFQRRF